MTDKRKKLIKQMEFVSILTDLLLDDIKNEDCTTCWRFDEIRPTKWSNDAIRIRRELNKLRKMMEA